MGSSINSPERFLAIEQRLWHLQEEAENRAAYIRRSQEPNVDHVGKVITGAISIVIDKPTKQATMLSFASSSWLGLLLQTWWTRLR